MSKKIKYFSFFSLIVLLVGCSFNKNRIWTGSQEEKDKISAIAKEQKKIEKINVYSSKINSDLKEITPIKSIKLNVPQKNSSWLVSDFNLQNYKGNLYLDQISNKFLKKKVGKNKFEISKISASPLFFNDNIFFSDDTGTVFSVNLRGKLNWKKNIYKKVFKKIYKNLSLAINKDKIFVSDNIGFIYSINIETGKILWIKNHGIPLKSRIKIFDNKLYLINQDNRLICLNINNGNLIWDVRSVSSFIKSQNFLSLAISKDENLFMLTSSGDLMKLSANSGRLYWTINTSSVSDASSDFFKSSDIVVTDTDVILFAESKIYSFKNSNGYLNWEKNIDSTNTPIVDSNYVFAVSDNGFVVCIDKISGQIIYSLNILKILKKRKQKTLITGFVLGSNKIYSTTMNGFLITSSAITGEVENFRKIGDSITSAPIISNGSLYILTNNSKILGFN